MCKRTFLYKEQKYATHYGIAAVKQSYATPDMIAV